MDAERSRPGEVGGRARGAELTEWAPRLCVARWGGRDSEERVFVMVMFTDSGSPAKYEDWDGVTTTRSAVSTSAWAEVPREIDIL